MLNQLNMWNKIWRIVTRLSERLDIDIELALDMFYTSRTCKALHDEGTGLYLLADNCIVDEVIDEIRRKPSKK